jgi:hypothetical protein
VRLVSRFTRTARGDDYAAGYPREIAETVRYGEWGKSLMSVNREVGLGLVGIMNGYGGGGGFWSGLALT